MRALGFLVPYRNELGKLHRWRDCSNIAAEAGQTERNGQLLAAVGVYSVRRRPARVIDESSDDPARQNVRLLVNYRDRDIRIARSIYFRIPDRGRRKLVSKTDAGEL